jgi:hypothetical protein
LRIRHGYNPNDVLGGGDGSDIYIGNYGDGYNIMIDHCSLQWAHGQSLDVWDNNGTPGRIHNIALSWSLAGETLQDHPVVTIAGSNFLANAAAMNDVDYHHNLLATDSHRIPLFKAANGHLINNLIYNWSYYSSLSGGGAVVDYINNVYKAGPLTPAPGTTGSFEIMAYSLPGCTSCGPSGDPSIYLSGNLGSNDPNGANNAANLFRQVSNEGPGTISIAPSSWVRSTPQGAGTGVAIVADPTAGFVTNVLNNVGASNKLSDTACDGSWVSNRDSVDTRMINEYNAGTGSYPTTQNDKGGFPTLAAGTPCPSTAHDGISDVWKIAHGLNPNDPSVAQKTAPNGYTYLENYLNGTDPNVTASTNPTVLSWAASLVPKAKMGSLMKENHLGGTGPSRSVIMNFFDPTVLPWFASNNRGSAGRQTEVSRAWVSAP